MIRIRYQKHKWLWIVITVLLAIDGISAQYNTKLGYNAGGIDTLGHKNVMVGAHAGELNNGSGNIFIGSQAGQNSTGSDLLIITNDTTKNTIYGDLQKQRVAIGTNDFPSDTTFRLAVEGKIIAREYKATQTMPWPDYVFDKNYQLRDLNSIRKYIEEHRHLPGIPSAEEINKQGIELARTNALLLEKIEELTLYAIQQQDRMDEYQSELVDLKIELFMLKQIMQAKVNQTQP